MRLTCRFEAYLTDSDGNDVSVEEYNMTRYYEYLSKEDINIFIEEVVEKLSKIMR